MKKIIAISLALFISFTSFAYAGNKAEVTAYSPNVDVASLQVQIQALLSQITALQAQLSVIQKEVVQLRIAFESYLQPGAENEEVRQLQEVLAKDKNIYPEGLVTGYYGNLTEKAVKKFQEKHGIEKAGVVGPKTRAKLNELYSKDGYKEEYKKEYVEEEKKKEYVEEKKKEEYVDEKKKIEPEAVKKEMGFAPEVLFNATPNSVSKGESIKLYWESTNASVCYAHENWSGTLEIRGDEELFPTEDITYAIKCKNDYGKTIKYVTVDVVE